MEVAVCTDQAQTDELAQEIRSVEELLAGQKSE